MLRSDLNRNGTHEFPELFFGVAHNVIFQHIDVNRRQFHVKLKSILNQIFILVFLQTLSTISMQQT